MRRALRGSATASASWEEPLSNRPDFAGLIADPARAAEVPSEEIPALLAKAAAEHNAIAAVERVLLARLATQMAHRNGDGDRLLTVDEAAARLGVTRDWLRRRPALPFVVKLSEGVVRYSAVGIGAFIEARKGCEG